MKFHPRRSKPRLHPPLTFQSVVSSSVCRGGGAAFVAEEFPDKDTGD